MKPFKNAFYNQTFAFSLMISITTGITSTTITGCGGSDLPLYENSDDQRSGSPTSNPSTNDPSPSNPSPIDEHDDALVLTIHSHSAQPPSNISISFSVQTDTGKPVPNLNLENFDLIEDNQPVSVESSQQIIPDENEFLYSTLLLLDFSDSVVDNNLETLKQAATEFINRLFNESGNISAKEVALAIFDGDPGIYIISDGYESDPAPLLALIEQLSKEEHQRDGSTNLFGAIEDGIDSLESHLAHSLHSASSQTLDRFVAGSLVLFSDGRDEAFRSTREDAINRVESAPNYLSIFTIGLGDDIDRDVLQAAGKDDFQQVDSIGQLVSTFINVGNIVDAKANSYYLLDYCSPRREGNEHTLEVIAYYEGLTGSMSIEYSANNFTAGCILE